MFDRLRLLFAKGIQVVCGGVEGIGVCFRQWSVAGSQACKEDRVARLLVAMQSLDQENPPYTSAVLEFVGAGSVSVLRIIDLAEAYEMGLGGSLVVKAAALAAVSASSLPGFLCVLASTEGSSGPVERLGAILYDGSLETDVQLP